MEERRAARIGTVSGLALLAGGTAVAAVAGGARSVFATVLLGLLAAGMGHALLDEIRRQARRRSSGGWAVHDTANTVLLGSCAGVALIMTVLAVVPITVRAVGLSLSLGYAVSCAYFVIERRRTIAVTPIVQSGSGVAPSPDSAGSAHFRGDGESRTLRGDGESRTTPGPANCPTPSPSPPDAPNTDVIPDARGSSGA